MRAILVLLLVLGNWPTSASGAGLLESFGVLWGGCWSTHTMLDERIAPQGLWGQALGGYAEWHLPWHRLSVLSEAVFAERGFTRQLNGGGEWPIVVSEAEYLDKYLALPIMLKFHLLEGEIQPYVVGGPSIDYRLNRFLHRADVRDEPNRWSTSIHLGLGVQWRSLEARGKYVFDPGRTTVSGPAGTTQSSGLHALELVGGVRFAL